MWSISEANKKIAQYQTGKATDIFGILLQDCRAGVAGTIKTGSGRDTRYSVTAEWFESLPANAFIREAYNAWMAAEYPQQAAEVAPVAKIVEQVEQAAEVVIVTHIDTDEQIVVVEQVTLPVQPVYAGRDAIREVLADLVEVDAMSAAEIKAAIEAGAEVIIRAKTGHDEITTLYRAGDLVIKQVAGEWGGVSTYAKPDSQSQPARRSFF